MFFLLLCNSPLNAVCCSFPNDCYFTIIPMNADATASFPMTVECCGERQRASAGRITRLCWDVGSSFPNFYKAHCEYPDYADWLMRVRGSFSTLIQITATIGHIQLYACSVTILLKLPYYIFSQHSHNVWMDYYYTRVRSCIENEWYIKTAFRI